MSRYVSDTTKYKIITRQNFTCANKPGSNLKSLDDYLCPMWKNNNGLPDENGFEIDHIEEFAISQNNDISNLQALCVSCHKFKTKKFISSRVKNNYIDESESDVSDDDLDDSNEDIISEFILDTLKKHNGSNLKTDYIFAKFKVWAVENKYTIKSLSKFDFVELLINNKIPADAKFVYDVSIEPDNFEDGDNSVYKLYLEERTKKSSGHIHTKTLYIDFCKWYKKKYKKECFINNRLFVGGLRTLINVKKNVRVGNKVTTGVEKLEIIK
jgi:hypothetical protein